MPFSNLYLYFNHLPISITDISGGIISSSYSLAYKKAGLNIVNIDFSYSGTANYENYDIFQLGSHPMQTFFINATNDIGERIQLWITETGIVRINVGSSTTNRSSNIRAQAIF